MFKRRKEGCSSFQFAFEAAASCSRSVVSGADADAFDFFKVGAVHTKPVMRAVCVYVFVSRLELLAGHLGTVMKGAYGDAVDVSSVFKV